MCLPKEKQLTWNVHAQDVKKLSFRKNGAIKQTLDYTKCMSQTEEWQQTDKKPPKKLQIINFDW